MKRLTNIVFLVICFLFYTSAFGQNKPSSPVPQSTPPVEDNDVVKISTSLIQIDATVLDKDGKIVDGLTADDFEIYENDKKQQITNFSFVQLQPDKSSINQSTEANSKKSGKNLVSIPPLPASLRPEQVRRTLALVVDDLSLSFTSVAPVKTALKKFIDEQMQSGDLVAIIRTSSGAGLLQHFTSNKQMLYAAIEKVRWYPNGRGGVGAFTPYEATMGEEMQGMSMSGASPKGEAQERESNREFSQIREDFFAAGTLGSVNYVINGMRELPGRKAVVLFSDGFRIYSSYRSAEGKEIKSGLNARLITAFQRLTDLANRSSVVIYTMDARGLANYMLNADDRVIIDQGDITSKRLDDIQIARRQELMDSQQGLRSLAEQTGGFALTNSSDLSKGVERVLNDQKGYYLLAYEPDDETFDDKKNRFNKLIIKLKRPDLQVRYRSGFFGISDESVKRPQKTPQQQIVNALTSPLNAGDIDLQLTSLFANDTQTGNFMRSFIYVNGNDLSFTEDADGWQKATFDIVAMVFGDNGTIVNKLGRTETIRAKAETLKEIRESGFVATITMPISKPGAYQMRVVLRDTETSKLGSASQFIEVPNLEKNKLTLSGILLQRVQSQVNDVKTSALPQKFQANEQRDVALRNFRPGMDIRFGYAIYNAKPDKENRLPNLAMQFRIINNGKIIYTSKDSAIKPTEQNDPQRLLAEGVFALGKDLQPGDYILQIIVKDLSVKEKNQIAVQWTDFKVVS